MGKLVLVLVLAAAALGPVTSARRTTVATSTGTSVPARPGSPTRGGDARWRPPLDPRPPPAPRLRELHRRPSWAQRLDELLTGHDAGVVVAVGRVLLYERGAARARPPASNQKLVLSMALLDVFGPRHRLTTRAVSTGGRRGVIRGDLWIVGRGDATLSSAPSGAGPLPFRATTIPALARRIRAAGVRRISGDVVGDASYFMNDWDAPGWQPYVQERYVALPSALALDANAGLERPAAAAAAALESALGTAGVEVLGRARSGPAPEAAREVARVVSAPLWRQLSYMNSVSSNFFAEVFGKLLGARLLAPPGTIAKGARALERWARGLGVRLATHDASGLSYADRVSPRALVRLLAAARRERWGTWLARVLPRAGEGTLADRLQGIAVRAKTGTHLNGASALSGWVRMRDGRWASFAILSRGMPKATEDEIVRVVASHRGPVARTCACARL
jgi:D-alanyl-D-alanine carboxypeptidase/D-alanyl-D-alanine-endopeptidase (penicillin-binding protein 4)